MENDDKETMLSKEEILTKSREENKNGDEREQQYLYKGAYLATAVGFLVYGIISVVLAIFDKPSYEMNIVIFAILGTMYTVFGLKTTKRKQLFLCAGIISIAASVVATVCWILQLCGVVVK